MPSERFVLTDEGFRDTANDIDLSLSEVAGLLNAQLAGGVRLRERNEALAADLATATAERDRLAEVFLAVRDWCIPGMNWTDDLAAALLADADAALAPFRTEDTPGE